MAVEGNEESKNPETLPDHDNEEELRAFSRFNLRLIGQDSEEHVFENRAPKYEPEPEDRPSGQGLSANASLNSNVLLSKMSVVDQRRSQELASAPYEAHL